MSGTTDKISGIANEAIGKAKQSVGSVVGSEKLKGEGAAQEIKGDAQKAVGDAKSRAALFVFAVFLPFTGSVKLMSAVPTSSSRHQRIPSLDLSLGRRQKTLWPASR
jgi:uncharacterized protein YjbJ (UPF0337 family)